MTIPYEGRPGVGGGALAGTLLSVALGAAAVAFFVGSARGGLAGHFPGYITGRPLVTTSAHDVVERFQRLNRLETVVYSLDTVVQKP